MEMYTQFSAQECTNIYSLTKQRKLLNNQNEIDPESLMSFIPNEVLVASILRCFSISGGPVSFFG
jgi:hypothetical protein